MGRETEAKNWYKQLIKNHADKKSFVAKAEGALRRFDLEGQTLELAGSSITGTRFDISSLRGKVVVVYYWDSSNQQSIGDFARMKELQLDNARIGVSGLSGLLRAPEGTVVVGMLDQVRQAFPRAQFENATEILQDARSIKSPEEVAWMERAAEILDQVVAAILARAKPGVMENEMVATIWQTIIANGGDYPSMTHWGAGVNVPWACRIAPHRPLKAGDMINTELEAKYGGYIAQTVQAACLGKIPSDLKRAFEASVKVFDELVKFMKPGVSYRAVIAFYQKLVREAGFIPKGMLLHGRGIGEDRPQITGEVEGDMYTSATYTQHLDLPLVEGNVFVLKPGAMPGDAPDSIRCGDTVVIEKAGARRLGKREFSFPEIN